MNKSKPSLEQDEVYESLKKRERCYQKKHDCLVYSLGILKGNSNVLAGDKLTSLIVTIEEVLNNGA